SRSDRKTSGQQFLERPAMIGQLQSHRRRAVVIPTQTTIGKRQPQSPMSSLKVVIEELQAHQCIPSVIAFGEGVRLAGEGIEPIAQGAVESFDMHGARWLDQHLFFAREKYANLQTKTVPLSRLSKMKLQTKT